MAGALLRPAEFLFAHRATGSRGPKFPWGESARRDRQVARGLP